MTTIATTAATTAVTGASTATSPPPSTPFTDLPTEIRFMIYKLVIDDLLTPLTIWPRAVPFDGNNLCRGALALLHVNRSIAAESAREMLPFVRSVQVKVQNNRDKNDFQACFSFTQSYRIFQAMEKTIDRIAEDSVKLSKSWDYLCEIKREMERCLEESGVEEGEEIA